MLVLTKKTCVRDGIGGVVTVMIYAISIQFFRQFERTGLFLNIRPQEVPGYTNLPNYK